MISAFGVDAEMFFTCHGGSADRNDQHGFLFDKLVCAFAGERLVGKAASNSSQILVVQCGRDIRTFRDGFDFRVLHGNQILSDVMPKFYHAYAARSMKGNR